MKQIAVFASGSGSNFQAIIDSVNQGDLKANIAGLVASRPGIGAIERAQKNNIPAKILSPKDFNSYQEYENELLELLQSWKPDLIVLAGYLLKIPESVLQTFENKIINIHPALLPKHGGKGFYGSRVHEAVISQGDNVSGCTVHYVNSEYDRGAIIKQVEVPVEPDDTPQTLASRVLEKEHILLPTVIKEILN